MRGPIIEVKNISKTFGDVQAVKDLSLSIAQGEIFSLLGPNGAGKTTTISMLSCLLSPSKGEAWIDGHSITRDALGVKRQIGVVPQEIALYHSISARENLVFWGRMYGLGSRELQQRVDAVLEIADLSERAKDKVETFSGGMKRRLNIAVGLLHDPKVLFLDEPTVGIDPQSRRRILETIQNLNQQGLTVLYTTHYMEEAEEISHRIGIIDHGQLIALGNLSQLTQLVGKHEMLQLDLVQNGYEIEEIAAGLAGLPLVFQAYGENGYLVLQTEDAESVLPGVVDYLNGNGVHIRRMEIQQPNLEAVFLHLTGRALRDL